MIEHYSYYMNVHSIGRVGCNNGQLNGLFTVIQKLDKIMNM